jgi:hypothetical protein
MQIHADKIMQVPAADRYFTSLFSVIVTETGSEIAVWALWEDSIYTLL